MNKGLGIILSIAIAALAATSAKADLDTRAGATLGSNGRFVMGQLSNMRRDQYLLDTKTGRLWTTTEGETGIELAPIRYWNALELRDGKGVLGQPTLQPRE